MVEHSNEDVLRDFQAFLMGVRALCRDVEYSGDERACEGGEGEATVDVFAMLASNILSYGAGIVCLAFFCDPVGKGASVAGCWEGLKAVEGCVSLVPFPGRVEGFLARFGESILKKSESFVCKWWMGSLPAEGDGLLCSFERAMAASCNLELASLLSSKCDGASAIQFSSEDSHLADRSISCNTAVNNIHCIA